MIIKPRLGSRIDESASINRDLRSWWLFNEGAGQTVRDIVGGNDGTLTNMDPASDWVGGALDFDGSNDIIVPSSNFVDVPGNNFSFSVWINP